MKPFDHPLLADENINPRVVAALLNRGKNIMTVSQAGLVGADDIEIMRCAYSQKRVVLTHDSDFGALAIRAGEPFIGVVFLRPGHISPEFVLRMIQELDDMEIGTESPFILVAERRENNMRVKLRKEK
jgi:predicted nuclease of predicted toxin-antitoxin system